jgi:hypothetical protein
MALPGTQEPGTGPRNGPATTACLEKCSREYDLLVFDELVYVLSYGMPVVEIVWSRRDARRSTSPAYCRHRPTRRRNWCRAVW